MNKVAYEENNLITILRVLKFLILACSFCRFRESVRIVILINF